MSVSSTAISIEYAGNESVVTPYTIPFAFLSADHIGVLVDDVEVSAGGFVVTRLGDGSGGSLVTSIAVAAESVIRIERRTPLTQPTEFALHGPFPSVSAETALDRLAMQVQETAAGRLDTAVLYVEQTLTEEQRAQALDNLGVTPNGDEPGALRYDSLQVLDAEEQAQAQENLGLGWLYLYVGHIILSSGAKLAVGRSRDGINWKWIGPTHGYVPPSPAIGIRDCSWLYWPETKEIIMVSTVTISTGAGYAAYLDLARTRDLVTWEHLANIAITGTGSTVVSAWGGTLVRDGDRVFMTCLPFAVDADKNTIGAGYFEFTAPGEDWTEVSDFTQFKAGNASFAACHDLNDIFPFKIGDIWHFLCDGYLTVGTGTGGLIHATSATGPFSGYGTPAILDEHSGGVEGAMIVERPEGGYRVYSQAVFGPLRYSDTDDFSSCETPAEINWPYFNGIGNGHVGRCDYIDLQTMVLAAPAQGFDTLDDSNANKTGQMVIPHEIVSIHMRALGTGNGEAANVLEVININADDPAAPVITIPPQIIARFTDKVTSGTTLRPIGFLAYENGNTKYGMGANSFELRLFGGGSDTHVSLGYISSGDGSTFVEVARAEGATKRFRLLAPTIPASAAAAGNAGEICWDADYIYVCTATNTWKRVAIATW